MPMGKNRLRPKKNVGRIKRTLKVKKLRDRQDLNADYHGFNSLFDSQVEFDFPKNRGFRLEAQDNTFQCALFVSELHRNNAVGNSCQLLVSPIKSSGKAKLRLVTTSTLLQHHLAPLTDQPRTSEPIDCLRLSKRNREKKVSLICQGEPIILVHKDTLRPLAAIQLTQVGHYAGEERVKLLIWTLRHEIGATPLAVAN